MPKLNDLSGQKIGYLKIISKAPSQNRKTYWNCVCDCGKECIIRGDRLKPQENGGPSCGCLRTANLRKKIIKIKPGDVYNRLTILQEETRASNGSIIWKCQCKCGKITKVDSFSLTSGRTKSCGCLQSETAKETLKRIVQSKQIKPNTIENGFYIYKVELRPTNSGNNETWCYAKCPYCDNIFWLRGHYLRNGDISSCGCMNKKSLGEAEIEKILLEENIKFEKQKIFQSCFFPDTEAFARFDFYLPDYNIVIEYDGIQHFKPVKNWGGEAGLKKTKYRDQIKNDWCRKNNIKIIRIPYLLKGEIKIEYLLETSPYLL